MATRMTELTMISRYKIPRGKPRNALPDGVRQDIRWRCSRHPLHSPEALVKEYLAAPGDKAWQKFRKGYRAELTRRFRTDRAPFDDLAALARTQDVYLGCSCPTQSNPRVDRCHTWVALEFMQEKYPDLVVRFPDHQPLD